MQTVLGWWLQAFVVICAYFGYKGLDFYSQYVMLVQQVNEVEAARFVSNASYLRVVGAIAAGFIADRFTTQKTLITTFLILIISYFVLSRVSTTAGSLLIVTNLLISFLAVYALRGVYFALFEETNVPLHLTGTTAGLVCLLGFTPDIFFYPLAGRIIDNSPDITGFQQFYLLLAVFSVLGLLAVWVMGRKGV